MSEQIVLPSVKGATSVQVKDIFVGDSKFECAELIVAGKTLRYVVEQAASKWRVNTLFKKEPMTIEWMHSFKPQDVFVDIGANIGMYSCYASQVMGAKVYSFEPESQNYAELTRNIFVNEASTNMTAWCAALADKRALSHLLLSAFGTGLSFHDFEKPSQSQSSVLVRQGAIGFSLDELIDEGAVPRPDHVKIDVDGHEHLVIKGMQRLLEGNHLKTLLLECDPRWPNVLEMVDAILDMGYIYNVDEFRLTRDGLLEADFVEDAFRRREFGNNIVFSRDPSRVDYASRWLKALDDEQRASLSVTPEEWYRSNPGLVDG